MYNIEELRNQINCLKLKEIAEELGGQNHKTLKKDDLRIRYPTIKQANPTPEQALQKRTPQS